MTTLPTFATCDACNQRTAIALKERTVRKGLVETYFECIVCGTHYPTAITNSAIRTKIETLKQLRLTDGSEPASIDALKAEIDADMKVLRKRYGLAQ
ncbi:hypothetical protein FO510_05555 [Bacillus pumilus]|uniref:hypothetical protein n=1 Tax=Bacillus pumilus TaxID=1408 RepID=UPI00054E9681|nr:hypothetical protein [Bacillus pumilus]MCR4352164.1 hypothetical protein [Bacillus pumilus]MCY7503975.1 hypothetical protein [Bacillus pumilus]MDR4269030.1 hypothetical protein [Bacillus pumilus]MDR4269117.1 hypothetical protein [Bacillus pumilus]MED4724260.1 hypothetical protein [Bacillus pumilus]